MRMLSDRRGKGLEKEDGEEREDGSRGLDYYRYSVNMPCGSAGVPSYSLVLCWQAFETTAYRESRLSRGSFE